MILNICPMLNMSHCGCLLRFQINAKYDFMKGKKPMICNSCTVLVIYSFSYNGSMLILCPVVAAILDCCSGGCHLGLLIDTKKMTKSRLQSTQKKLTD